MQENKKKAIVLYSGGLDSTTCLYEAIQSRDVYVLTVDYAQRHSVEIERARSLRKHLGIENERHVVLRLPNLSSIAVSALTHHSEVPQEGVLFDGIPPTYVPGRNVIFLSLALAWAESVGAREIWTGVNALDYSGYPDCRPEFIQAFENMCQEGIKSTAVEGYRVEIVTPLIHLTKAEIAQKAKDLNVPISQTHSCYSPKEDGTPCKACDSCLLRVEGLKQVGIHE